MSKQERPGDADSSPNLPVQPEDEPVDPVDEEDVVEDQDVVEPIEPVNDDEATGENDPIPSEAE